MLGLLGIALVGATTFFASYQLFSGEIQASQERQLLDKKRKATSLILRICRPLFRTLVLPYSQKFKLENWKKNQKRYLISAGLEDEIDPEELLAFKVFLGVVAPFFIIAYQSATQETWPWWVYATMVLGGFVYPSVWVSASRKKRHEEIKLQLPFVIDLLTLSTEAGLDFIGALQKVVEKTRSGPLVDEIERMIQEIQLGTTRSDAMRHMAWRIDLTEVSSLVAVLVTADQMGSSLGGVLRVQSDLIRTQRFTNAEKKGAAASQKLLVPLIFFIMPAVFIMIFGPVILSVFSGK